MINLHQQIADLEAEIDALSDAAERCRKSMVVAKAGVGVGILLFVVSLLGLIRPDAILLVVGIAAALAGMLSTDRAGAALRGFRRKSEPMKRVEPR